MQINPKYKVRNVANENIVLVQGRNAGDMTTVVALNDSSLYLWNALYGRQFEIEDVATLLTERYDVDMETATKDAAAWVETMRQNDIML